MAEPCFTLNELLQGCPQLGGFVQSEPHHRAGRHTSAPTRVGCEPASSANVRGGYFAASSIFSLQYRQEMVPMRLGPSSGEAKSFAVWLAAPHLLSGKVRGLTAIEESNSSSKRLVRLYKVRRNCAVTSVT